MNSKTKCRQIGNFIEVPAGYFGKHQPFKIKKFIILPRARFARFLNRFESKSMEIGRHLWKLHILDIPKASRIQVNLKCSTCGSSLTRKILHLRKGADCKRCSYRNRGINLITKNLRDLEVKNNITFITKGNCKGRLRYRKNACGCEGLQIPDNIRQQGLNKCQHEVWLCYYLEKVVKDECNGVATTIRLSNGRLRFLDCVTNKYVFEVKLNWAAINGQAKKRYISNNPIYQSWATANGRAYYVLIGQKRKNPAPAGLRFELGLEDWKKVGFTSNFINRIANIEEEYIKNGRQRPERKALLEKYKSLALELNRHLNNTECLEFSGLTLREFKLLFGHGKYCNYGKVNRLLGIDLKPFKPGPTDEALSTEYLKLVRHKKHLPSESEVQSNLNVTNDKIMRIFTGRHNAKNSELIQALKRNHRIEVRAKGRRFGLDEYRNNVSEKRLKKRRNALACYISISAELGFLLPKQYCMAATGVSIQTLMLEATGNVRGKMKDLSKSLGIPTIGKSGTGAWLYKFDGKILRKQELISKLGPTHVKHLINLFSKNNGKVITLSRVKRETDSSSVSISQKIVGAKLSRIGKVDDLIKLVVAKNADSKRRS